MSTLGSAGAGFGLVSRQNSVEKSVFCLLWGPRALDLGAAVEHFFNFGDFCSTFGGAVGGFGVGGRTFFQF